MKGYTDIEQSKKLTEILSLESADMYYFLDPTPAGNIYHIVTPQIDFGVKTKKPEYNKGDIPAWSLAALLDILPSSITSNAGIAFGLNIKKNIIEYSNPSLYLVYKSIKSDNLIDACVNMIIKLNELNLL